MHAKWIFFAVLGIEFRASHIQKHVLSHWIISTQTYTLIYHCLKAYCFRMEITGMDYNGVLPILTFGLELT